MFPVGTTSVTCTATDAASNTATCSFPVTVFSFCLQDDSSPGNVVFVNASTGDYLFCSGGVQIASGRGTLTVRGCQFGIEHIKGDRKVIIGGDTSANSGLGAGNAVINKTNGHMVIQITDRNMSNNTCQCSPPPPQTIPREKPDPGKRVNGN
jgi:HYR domain-containing protein